MKRLKNTVKRATAMMMAIALLWTLQPTDVLARNAIAKGSDVSKYNGGVDFRY